MNFIGFMITNKIWVNQPLRGAMYIYIYIRIYIYRTSIPISLIRRNEVFRDIDWHLNCCLSSFYLGDM